MYISTGLSSTVDDWDKNEQIYTGKGAKSVNAVLKTILATTNARILELREIGIFDKLDNKQLKSMLQNPDAEKQPKATTPTVADMFNSNWLWKLRQTNSENTHLRHRAN